MLPWPPHGPCEALKRGGCEGASSSRISPEGEGETITAVGSSGDLARELGVLSPMALEKRSSLRKA